MVKKSHEIKQLQENLINEYNKYIYKLKANPQQLLDIESCNKNLREFNYIYVKLKKQQNILK